MWVGRYLTSAHLRMGKRRALRYGRYRPWATRAISFFTGSVGIPVGKSSDLQQPPGMAALQECGRRSGSAGRTPRLVWPMLPLYQFIKPRPLVGTQDLKELLFGLLQFGMEFGGYRLHQLSRSFLAILYDLINPLALVGT